nr:mevalonate kinase [Ipomoea batatas]
MEILVRAPAKIILAGEHAVVHGSTAVAAAIDLYTYVSLRFLSPSENDQTLKLQLKDVPLEFSWPVARIRDAFPNLDSSVASSPSSCSLETLKSIASLVEKQKIPEANIGLASGVSAFLWLYTSILGCKPAKAVVHSELPMGAGLGSSAALCVALSAAFLSLSDSISIDFSQKGWQTFRDSELELVNKWAFEGENIIHGKPSGVDNTVSTYDDLAITEKEEKMGELMEMNQGLLQCMGVSHSSIETVLRTTAKYKLYSKLIGAGGGGCVLTLLPTLLSGTVINKVIAELEACGFQCLIAGIGGSGVEVSFTGASW